MMSSKECKTCKAIGFDQSILGDHRCTFCDGTEAGNPPTVLDAAVEKSALLSARLEAINMALRSFRYSPLPDDVKHDIYELSADKHRGQAGKISEENLLRVVDNWKFSWMDVKGTDEKDRKNYYERAFGVDANMKYDLVRRMMNYFLTGEPR